MKRIFPGLFVAFILVSALGCKKDKTGDDTLASDKKSFLSFSFKKSANPDLPEDLAATVKNDTIYAEAPSGVPVDKLIADFTFEGKEVSVSNTPQESGKTAHDFSLPVTYTITAENGSQENYVVVFGSDVPMIYLTTAGEAVIEKEEYTGGTIRITAANKNFAFEGPMRIKGRGNSTWGMPKKPYKFKLESKASLLGLPADKTWVLLANYGDKTMMRNELAFELSRRLGLPFTPKATFVEVTLNGKYEGTYQLVEQIEVAKHKVNVEEQSKNASSLPEIAGGYLLEVDGYAWSEPFNVISDHSVPITVHYPDADDATDAQRAYITNYIRDFENALFADNFADPANGYRKYFDVDAFINYYLVNEIMGNSDMLWSTYFAKTRTGKLVAGPVWDFDLAGNQDKRLDDAVNKTMLDNAHEPRAWMNRLIQDKAFMQAVRKRWNEVKSDKVFTLISYLNQLQYKLQVTQKRNFARWPGNMKEPVNQIWNIAGSYDGEVQFLRNFLERRMSWLDGQLQSSRFQ
ncbi:MAG: CotH kinase family protein [Mucilaginibacter polytrichastri]|nr:CotH kinase family protein [Mucilaginibacter polytrichastri]